MNKAKLDEIDNLLSKVYYDPKSPGSFGGVQPLLKQANELLLRSKQQPLRKVTVENWLRGSEAYTTHKQVSDKFKRNPIKVNYVNELWEIDVLFYKDIASRNKGFGYVLAVLDTASRYMRIRMMKRKTCLAVLNAFKSIIEEAGISPKLLMSDRGTEFKCKSFQNFLDEKKIKHYHKHSGDVKTAHLDRATRTVQTRLHRLFTHFNTRDFVTYLPQIVESYNNSVNRSIGMSPNTALTKYEKSIDKRQQQVLSDDKGKRKLRKGQYVRILGDKKGHHAYKGDWTFKIFKIRKVIRKADRKAKYYLKYLNGENVIGAHYIEELQWVKKPEKK